MEIINSKKSKLKNVDFNNLSFGTFFSDHMFMCKYSNGSWKNPKILPYGSISLDPSISSLHYGQAVFEGMKAYKDENDEVSINMQPAFFIVSTINFFGTKYSS